MGAIFNLIFAFLSTKVVVRYTLPVPSVRLTKSLLFPTRNMSTEQPARVAVHSSRALSVTPQIGFVRPINNTRGSTLHFYILLPADGTSELSSVFISPFSSRRDLKKTFFKEFRAESSFPSTKLRYTLNIKTSC